MKDEERGRSIQMTIDLLTELAGLDGPERLLIDTFIAMEPRDRQKATSGLLYLAGAFTEMTLGERLQAMTIDQKADLYRRELMKERDTGVRSVIRAMLEAGIGNTME